MNRTQLTVEDRLQILELLTRADDAASRRDVETYLALFTDDASLEGDRGTHQGKAALSVAVPHVWESEDPNSRHLTLNPVVAAAVSGRDDLAVATSTLLIVTPGAPPVLASMSTITQLLARVDGAWRIQRRTVSA